MNKTLVSLSLVLAMSASTAESATLFFDSFQNASDLAPFNPGSSANIVYNVPGGGNALGFTRGGSGGDLFTTNFFASVTGKYVLSFMYEGLGNGGGYVGINSPFETWLAGDGSYPTTIRLSDNTGWNTYSIAFASANPVQIKLEEWNGQNSTPNQALFKNLLLTDGNGPSQTVPEPTSIPLLAIGLLGFYAASRKAALAKS